MTVQPTKHLNMALLKLLLFLLPQKLLSYLVGCFFRVQRPKWLVKVAKLCFIKVTKIELQDSLKEFDEFASVQELFTRQLKTGARHNDSNSEFLIQPADGKLLSQGSIKEDLTIKGINYNIARLLFGENKIPNFMPRWHQITYLSPQDYHRVHSPCDGILTKINYHSGKLWTVAPGFVAYMPSLFSVNERLVFHFSCENNFELYLVMVGSLNVGRMSSVFVPNMFTNNSFLKNTSSKSWLINKKILKMDEIGIFNLGSTVAIFTNKIPTFNSNEQKSKDTKVKVGDIIRPIS